MRTPENSTTTCGEEVTAESPSGAPGPINPSTGQHTCYYVLKPEERAKGFVRPVRTSYRHVGKTIELESDDGTVFENFIPACNTVTTMSRDIAETYAREPGYYGSTFCCACGRHLPVGEAGEFVWEDGSKVGT